MTQNDFRKLLCLQYTEHTRSTLVDGSEPSKALYEPPVISS